MANQGESSIQQAPLSSDEETLSTLFPNVNVRRRKHSMAETGINDDIAINNLRRKLHILVDDLEEIYHAGVAAASDVSQAAIFRGMFKSAESLFGRFKELHEELTDMSQLTEEDRGLRSAAKRYYYGACTQAETFSLNNMQNNSINGSLNQSSFSSRPRAKLPTIDLPKFDGQRITWQRFKETFESLVINDPDLLPIDKFHYLVSSLKDSAHAVIANIPLTEANFPIAWQALIDSFDNPRLAATAHLDQLLSIATLTSKPTNEKLKQVTNHIVENIAALKQIKIDNLENFLLFYLARRCFDRSTREAFELLQDQEKFPTYEQFIKFLRNRCNAGELAVGLNPASSTTVETRTFSHRAPKPLSPKYEHRFKSLIASTSKTINQPSKPFIKTPQNSYKIRSNTPPPCPLCKERHFLFLCRRFNSMDVKQRHASLGNWEGCRNCLVPFHKIQKCESKSRCKFCRAKHSSLLHDDHFSYRPQSPKQNVSSPSQSSNNTSCSGQTLSATALKPSQIIMGTALCSILDIQGKPHTIRLVMDSGSQFSFLSRKLAARLGIKVKPCHVNILGIGQTPFTGSTGRAECRLVSHLQSAAVSTQALVVDNITTHLPSSIIPETLRQPFTEYELADPEFWNPHPIDFLLGSDLFADVLTGEIITLAPGQPKLIGTIFGFVIMGKLTDLSQAMEVQALCATFQLQPPNKEAIMDDIQKLWELEESPSVQVANPEDTACEKHFIENHYRLPSGRYVVKLPFKGTKPRFPYTRWMALKRLNSIEAKLQRDVKLKSLYSNFMSEYLELGHMQVANQKGEYLIPHHGVFKANGDKASIRVVFDASAPSGIGSLNNYLLKGPKLQNSIPDIILNFRTNKIAFTADISKMFRQILVDPADRAYQHILWRNNPEAAVTEYELCTVTYGQACAPFLAIRTIQQLAVEEGQSFPLAVAAIEHDMYVDDFVSGASSIQEAVEKRNQLVNLLKKGGFSLAKWMSNCPELLADIPVENTSILPKSIDDPEDKTSVKILGLQWDPKEDIFSFKVSPPNTICTKRAILAAVARIYDPLGFLGPVIIVAKILIQAAWKSGADWDSPLPNAIQTKWRDFVEHLPLVSNITIPRWILPNSTTKCNILIFGDASETAYCAAAYLRVESDLGIQVSLLISKTKVAPTRPISIPRLELCAALLSVKLLESLHDFSVKLPGIPEINLFTDSTVVLAWLNTEPHKLKTFVANRVARILRTTTAAQWSHVRSEDNPSDLGSRGVAPETLLNSSFWFHGPIWAQRDPVEWPITPIHLINQNVNTIPEIKPMVTSCLINKAELIKASPIHNLINRSSSYLKVINVIRRIVHLRNSVIQKRSQSVSEYSQLSEREQALIIAIKASQELAFNDNKPLTIKALPKALLPLRPFLDERKVLRVGGRVELAKLAYNAKHPYILPAKCPLTELIIKFYHKALLHPGPSLLLSVLRRKFWIVGARNIIRAHTLKCITCRKLHAPTRQPIMADLPVERLKEGRVFSITGIDFAGPFMVRDSLRRKALRSKCYLCLFICLGSRAIHLEAVSSISTPAFCAAFDRFVSRRGLPSLVLSDNGTNFVGASNQLRELYSWYRRKETQKELINYASDREIEWKFVPPHAPHFGGCWEAGVKSAKRLLRTAYGEGAFTYEELSTLFAKVEAILNSRPICPASDDVEDLDALTPGHLIIGGPLIAPPEHSLLELKESYLDRWKLVKQRTQMFWKRWKDECLHQLQIRTKWRKSQPNIKPNDLVLIKGEDTPRQKWPLGRVVKVFPGRDGIVRVADVRTKNSVLRRPVAKLVLLLSSDEEN